MAKNYPKVCVSLKHVLTDTKLFLANCKNSRTMPLLAPNWYFAKICGRKLVFRAENVFVHPQFLVAEIYACLWVEIHKNFLAQSTLHHCFPKKYFVPNLILTVYMLILN